MGVGWVAGGLLTLFEACSEFPTPARPREVARPAPEVVRLAPGAVRLGPTGSRGGSTGVREV